ncbi:VanW like protein [Tumebacillus sp. BK434]|uniref:VanW family protein n=1 Tax=Tumebacillus sp. BK434 TaxID=2512169 RepID=UPI0010F295B5|nr:VanW family protein [Tumebacillus sp. BK434]TCP52124.1 VanW like protein [Tumebacillus sp. BK434]
MNKRKKKRRWVLTFTVTGLLTAAAVTGAYWQAGGFSKPVVQPAEAATAPPQTSAPVRPQPIRPEDEKFVPVETVMLTPQDNHTQRAIHDQYQAYLQQLPAATGELVGSFQTSLAGHSAEGRVKNIMLANGKLNGRILLPGEELSFNNTLGDSNDPAGGWQLATVIIGKKFEQGYGGGICQVSSTLYNSVLRAGLGIVERYTHSLPVGYVPPGQDATVSYPELDFRFVNSYEAPVKIEASIVEGMVVSKLYRLPAFQYDPDN